MDIINIIILIMLIETARTNDISTAQGTLRGVIQDGYVSYEGIPYATIAGSMGRFKRAGIAPVWRGVRESQTPRCLSTSDPEECLKLDVYVPSSGSISWPVLVWVSGGSGYYNPGKLVQNGIILVIVHHRHGPHGFLCLNDDNIPGNAGVKDIVIALRWVRDNIVAFKGNPSHVALAGQSFGAAIVEAIILSPMGNGLYHSAILQSGTILAPWTFNYDAKERAEALADLIDTGSDQITTILKAKIEDLVSTTDKLDFPYLPFGICKEIYHKSEETLILEAPIDLKRESQIVPLMIGFNSDEAYIFASILKDPNFTKKRITESMFLLPDELKKLNERDKERILRQIKDKYFEGNTSMSKLLAFHRDAYFTSHVYRSASFHASSNVPVYFYQFSHVSDIGITSEPDVIKSGAAHSDELGYLFPNTDLGEEDAMVQEIILKLWTNFVKYFDPTAKGPLQWDTLDVRHPRLLDIDTEPQMIDFPYTKAARMWIEIYDKYYYKKNRNVL